MSGLGVIMRWYELSVLLIQHCISDSFLSKGMTCKYLLAYMSYPPSPQSYVPCLTDGTLLKFLKISIVGL